MLRGLCDLAVRYLRQAAGNAWDRGQRRSLQFSSKAPRFIVMTINSHSRRPSPDHSDRPAASRHPRTAGRPRTAPASNPLSVRGRGRARRYHASVPMSAERLDLDPGQNGGIRITRGSGSAYAITACVSVGSESRGSDARTWRMRRVSRSAATKVRVAGLSNVRHANRPPDRRGTSWRADPFRNHQRGRSPSRTLTGASGRVRRTGPSH